MKFKTEDAQKPAHSRHQGSQSQTWRSTCEPLSAILLGLGALSIALSPEQVVYLEGVQPFDVDFHDWVIVSPWLPRCY